jgi:hypothetical protein
MADREAQEAKRDSQPLPPAHEQLDAATRKERRAASMRMTGREAPGGIGGARHEADLDPLTGKTSQGDQLWLDKRYSQQDSRTQQVTAFAAKVSPKAPRRAKAGTESSPQQPGSRGLDLDLDLGVDATDAKDTATAEPAADPRFAFPKPIKGVRQPPLWIFVMLLTTLTVVCACLCPCVSPTWVAARVASQTTIRTTDTDR